MNERCDNCGGRRDRPGLYDCRDWPHPWPTPAQRVVAAIERELRGRRLGWGDLSDEVADELRDKLVAIAEGCPS